MHDLSFSSTGVSAASQMPAAAGGRPTLYGAVSVSRLYEVVRRDGLSDSAAAVRSGIGVSTLSDWKKAHPELPDLLAMAREEFRERKLAIINEAKTADGRPDWRAAAWLLEKTFPEDYGRRRIGDAAEGGWATDAAPGPERAPWDGEEPVEPMADELPEGDGPTDTASDGGVAGVAPDGVAEVRPSVPTGGRAVEEQMKESGQPGTPAEAEWPGGRGYTDEAKGRKGLPKGDMRLREFMAGADGG